MHRMIKFSQQSRQIAEADFRANVVPLLSGHMKEYVYGEIYGEHLTGFPPFSDDFADGSFDLYRLRIRLAHDAACIPVYSGSTICQQGASATSMLLFLSGELGDCDEFHPLA